MLTTHWASAVLCWAHNSHYPFLTTSSWGGLISLYHRGKQSSERLSHLSKTSQQRSLVLKLHTFNSWSCFLLRVVSHDQMVYAKKKKKNCKRQFYHQNGSHSTQTLARTDALCKLGSSMKMLALHLFPLCKLKADRQLIFGWVSRSQTEVMSWVVLGYPNLRVSPSWISGQSLLFPGDRLWNHSQGLRGPWPIRARVLVRP